MSGRKPSQLPSGEYRDLLEDAMERGKRLSKGAITDGSSAAILGLCDILVELINKDSANKS